MSINVEAWLRIDPAFRSDRLRGDRIKGNCLFSLHSGGETIKRVFVGAIVATLRRSGVAELEFKRSLAIGRQLV